MAHLSKQQRSFLEQQLVNRREALFRRRQAFGESWRVLQQPEVELEETAQKEKISQSIDQLDEQSRALLDAIDGALRRIRSSNYGRCQRCGGAIPYERLRALPWTTACSPCADLIQSRRVTTGPVEAGVPASGRSPDLGGLSDEELEYAIRTELESDARIDLQELTIACREGVVHLEGALSSHADREILYEILEDNLGLSDVVDHTHVSRQLQEGAGEHKAQRQRWSWTEDDTLLEGEPGSDDAYESRKSGEPLEPADELTPEGEPKP